MQLTNPRNLATLLFGIHFFAASLTAVPMISSASGQDSVSDELREFIAPVESTVRIATFNCSMNRNSLGKLRADLAANDTQIARIATIIRLVRPDILLLNEIDFEEGYDNAAEFSKKYLAGQSSNGESRFSGTQPIDYPYIYSAPVNTGVLSGLDLNGNGKTTDPEDAWGFGTFPGQYGMAVLSKYPINVEKTRTFQNFLWADLRGARKPILPDTGKSYYEDAIWSKLRLSSKSFWDVCIELPNDKKPQTLHFLVSHPTPPVFDGPEDRNGCRNADEIKLLVEYISKPQADFLVDDQNRRGGLAENSSFVVAGDLNADPIDGDGIQAGIKSLLDLPQVQDSVTPRSKGAAEAAIVQAGKNTQHAGSSDADTGDFNDRSVGNLRIDYVLPSADLKVLKSGVFWPTQSQLKGIDPDLLNASDHRLVWIDVAQQ